MKILIDNSNLVVGGGIQVGSSFLNDLRSVKSGHEFFVIQSFNSKESVDKSLFPSNFYFYDLDSTALGSIRKRRSEVVKLEKQYSPDIIFVTFGPSYHKSKVPKIVGFAIPYLIYPESPFFLTNSIFVNLKYKLLGLVKKRFFIRNSDALIFESEVARVIFAEKMRVVMDTYTVNNTLNEIFYDKSRWKEFSREFNSSLNILCLTANYKHKNLNIIPSVIDCLLSKYNFKDFKFVITVGKDNLCFDDKYDQYIDYLGKVSLSQVPELYSKIDISFQPTLLEVFSTTYLEAMFMGKPIVASDLPFAREICGDGALYCDPVNSEDYAQVIYSLAVQVNLREQIVEKGYQNLTKFGKSIDRTNQYLRIIEDVYNRKK